MTNHKQALEALRDKVAAWVRAYRLWRWDADNTAVLYLAVRRQTISKANGTPSPHLQAIIDGLRKERALISEAPDTTEEQDT